MTSNGRKLLSCAILALLLLQAVPVNAREKPLAFLSTDGRRLVDETGETVVLRGCNIGCWLLIEPWMIDAEGQVGSEKELWDLLGERFGEQTKQRLIRIYRDRFFTEEDVERLAARGVNCIRVPIWWRAVSDPAYGGSMDDLDRCVRWCSERGISVILDLHGSPGPQSTQSVITGEPADAGLWKDPAMRDRTVEWWMEVSARYKDEPTIAGYDLLNEAYSAPFHELLKLYDRIHDELRQSGDRHVLILEDGLQGFHRLPEPGSFGWEDVMYSFHYYPQDPEESYRASADILPAFNRAAIEFGVPILVGEFNTIFKNRGGVDVFQEYCDVFDYFGWSWTFWSFKKLEVNHDVLWGLVGYSTEARTPDFQTASLDEIEAFFESLDTANWRQQPLLPAVLESHPRWLAPAAAEDEGEIPLTLHDAWIIRGEGGQIRMEWQWTPPNIGYWKVPDRVGWTVHVPDDGTYALHARVANHGTAVAARVYVDGVSMGPIEVGGTEGWRGYADRFLGRFALKAGRHTILIEQADDHSGFLNLRGARLEVTGGEQTGMRADRILLDPVTADPSSLYPVRVEWMNNPPNFAFWPSGESVDWTIAIARAGRYRIVAEYSTPNKSSRFRVLIDGVPVAEGQPRASGGWHEFSKVRIGEAMLSAGVHRISAAWEANNDEGTGNLRGLYLGLMPEEKKGGPR